MSALESLDNIWCLSHLRELVRLVLFEPNFGLAVSDTNYVSEKGHHLLALEVTAMSLSQAQDYIQPISNISNIYCAICASECRQRAFRKHGP